MLHAPVFFRFPAHLNVDLVFESDSDSIGGALEAQISLGESDGAAGGYRAGPFSAVECKPETGAWFGLLYRSRDVASTAFDRVILRRIVCIRNL
jgi:hypothetical protein